MFGVKTEEKKPVAKKPVKKTIAPITNDFSRQDLNEMRDKINEIISKM